MSMHRRGILSSALLAPFGAMGQRAGARADTIRKVEAIPARVPYRSTFVIGRGLVAKGGQGGTYIYVRVESESGLTGWGETISLPAWSYETPESIVSTVEK